MGDPGKEEYKIQCFDAETQQLLKTALKAALGTEDGCSAWQRSSTNCPGPRPSRSTQDRNPGAVDLEKVANVIVDHSLQDSVFSKEAGRMCHAIIQAESKQAGQSVFRRGLLNRLQQEYQTREQLRARSLQGWVCYVTFICNIFDYLRVNNMPMMALVNPVYDCLFRLAQPDSLSKEEEVDCLVLQLHRVGEQLEKMNGQRMDELFVLIRDGFLLPAGLSSLAQLLLLEIIEFRAAGWKTTPAAHKYYYSEVSA
uniref:MIF4G domain containing n=1 Tax=Ovis aries TaxID=9940 RepID=A0AC11B1J5_SHEEP